MFDRSVAACITDHFIILSMAILDLDFIGKSTDVDDDYLNEAYNLGHVLVATVRDEFPTADPKFIILFSTLLAINYENIATGIHEGCHIEPDIFPSKQSPIDPLDIVRQKLVSLKVLDEPAKNTLRLNAEFINTRVDVFIGQSEGVYTPNPAIYEPLVGLSDTSETGDRLDS